MAAEAVEHAAGYAATSAAWRRRARLGPLAAAAGSRTPDWAAKVEWLEAQGLAQDGGRLQYRRRRIVRRRPAAATGNVAAVRFALEAASCGLEAAAAGADAASAAAAAGHVAVLEALREAGIGMRPWFVACEAAGGGHLSVLFWLESTVLGAAGEVEEEEEFEEAVAAAPRWHFSCPHVVACAARSGRPEVLAWLRERGCPWDEQAVTNAAEAGSAEALEWLAERGCPMPSSGEPYVAAARNGDLQTLACLRRLGCPWGPAQDAFTRCVFQEGGEGGCALPVLAYLLEAGCPVEWGAALRMARLRRRRELRRGGGCGAGSGGWSSIGGAGAVLAWLEAQKSSRQASRSSQGNGA
ncbi:hypothetical protein GPECTOR_31g296 [Gonium pectorale]|uniref:Ankyrin repeat domain-containing protein n=1 Tax=Gonium pectorale TaxID=33097 RepID=A0A150GDL7_GONPE|nr:hypothetical protein GPECTOR_31g296 [Gonium pectorale]|eukprot:KXZ47934.1 hypothetical protein GPECTOR_31g296 [Gonium pectorale]